METLLKDLIVGEIKRLGPMPFDRFMELALYHPELGYYRGKRDPIGDYVTAPEVSRLFGRIVGRFVARLLGYVSRGEPVPVIELGAGSGRLASSAVASAEMAPLCAGGKAFWVATDVSYGGNPPREEGRFLPVAAAGVSPFKDLGKAVVVANEFFDALPRKVVEFQGGSLGEVLVGEEGGRLVEVRSVRLSPGLEGHAASLPPLEGGRFEVCPAAGAFLADLAGIVGQGFLVIADYGGAAEDKAAWACSGGTLRTFRKHVVGGDPLEAPGEADITGDVDFDDLARRGAELGWEVIFEGPQRDFLLTLGLMEDLAALARAAGDARGLAEYLAAKRLLVPEGLQERFRIQVQARGIGAGPEQVRTALGLT